MVVVMLHKLGKLYPKRSTGQSLFKTRLCKFLHVLFFMNKPQHLTTPVCSTGFITENDTLVTCFST